MNPKIALMLGTHRLSAVGFLALTAAALTSVPFFSVAAAWQAVDSIRAAATEAVGKSIGTEARVEAMAIDERIKLPSCAEPLHAELVRTIERGRGTVAVSCPTEQRWQLFVPVRVSEQVPVVVVRNGIPAGQTVGATDIDVRYYPSTALPADYLSNPAQAIGLTLRRAVPAGSVLGGAVLQHPEIVARGARVTLVSGSGSVLVKSEGVALEPARLKQRVRVRSPSGRIVEGVVQASGEVRVGS